MEAATCQVMSLRAEGTKLIAEDSRVSLPGETSVVSRASSIFKKSQPVKLFPQRAAGFIFGQDLRGRIDLF